MWPGKVRDFAYHVCVILGTLFDAVHQPHQPAESKLAYGKRLTICVQCTLLGLVGYHKRPILLR